VINLEPSTLEEVFQCMLAVGNAAGIPEQAQNVVGRLQARVDAVNDRTANITDRPRVVLLEWIDPPFSSGHWSPELVRMAGGIEMVGCASQRSRTLDWQAIVEADPEFLILACCGFDVARTLQDLPILTRYPNFERLTCVQSRNVYVVDGNAYFSRPGPRLVDSLEILANTLHPLDHSLPSGLRAARRSTHRELNLA
jgi:iron complex transport system substrate-binding protein